MEIYQDTSLNVIGMIFVLIMGVLILVLPRRLAFIPIIITACYMTLGQQLLISVFHFSALRIIILFSLIRLFMRREIFTINLNTIDKAIIFWVISSFVIYNLHDQTTEAFINRLGFAYSAIGVYFSFRAYIRDLDDVKTAIISISIIIIPLAIEMLSEYITGRNIFSILGGVSEEVIFRDGRLRCQGPFRHPILAGSLGATLLPLLVALWFQEKRSKLLTAAGIISATIITITSASSGPLMVYCFSVFGLLMWRFRMYMRALRWGALFALISLHLVMKAPVWFLIARLANITGGTGWHRAFLIDQAISHFDQWWLLGMRDTAGWLPYALAINPTSTDVTNQYIAEGLSGGLLTMLLFIMIIILCFRTIGLSLKALEKSSFAENIMVWSLGASLFAHALNFISVSYFDQIIIFWYLSLAMISAVGDSTKDKNGSGIIANGDTARCHNFA